jgi:hypothetical protein
MAETPKLPPRATTTKGNLSARIKPKKARRERVAPSAPKVTVHWSMVDRLWRFKETPGGREALRKARDVQAAARRNAPVSKTGSHRRKPGYLRSRIGLYIGQDETSMYVDVVTRAKDRHGNYYGRIVNQRDRYLEQGIQEAKD